MSLVTNVIHIRDAPEGWKKNSKFIYIGRPRGNKNVEYLIPGDEGYFGNPYILRKEEERGATLEKFEKWARKRIEKDSLYRNAVKNLIGKSLVCFCVPQSCHGGVLIKMAWEILSWEEERAKETTQRITGLPFPAKRGTSL